jgi:hypothetical protein
MLALLITPSLFHPEDSLSMLFDMLDHLLRVFTTL